MVHHAFLRYSTFSSKRGWFLLFLLFGIAIISFPTLQKIKAVGRMNAVVQTDNNTLLVLGFENTLNGAQGETPSQASGYSFQSGLRGNGILLPANNQLFYPASGNINATEGTLECWVKPAWDGNDEQHHSLLSYGGGGGILMGKDSANNLKIILNLYGGAGGGEIGTAVSISAWKKDQWHHLAFTWSNTNKVVRLYTDGRRASQTTFSATLPAISISSFQLGGAGSGSYLNATIDEVRISNVERTASEINQSVMAGVTVSSLTLNPTSVSLLQTWYKDISVTGSTNLGTMQLPGLAITWSSSNPAVATVSTEGRVTGVSAGNAIIRASINGVQTTLSVTVTAPVLSPTVETISSLLKTPAPDHIWEVPVVVISYLPTKDGINVDAAATNWNSSLASLKQRIERMTIQKKFMREEASRFRGYKNAAAKPSLGFKVVHFLTIYEEMPTGYEVPWKIGQGIYFPEYNQILNRIGAENFVNNLGVKEFWIWGYHHGNIEPVESNMSSPLTGDISNSSRFQDDMPVFRKTYTMYNFGFTGNTSLHTVGHQLEATLSHLNNLQDRNDNLFWTQFSGRNANGSFKQGRSGNAHYPPNGVREYDYFNPTLVESDIEDWTPAGTGQKKLVNADTWHKLSFAWPNNELLPGQIGSVIADDANWYLYWTQNMPGRGNRIAHNGGQMTNWWAFMGDWEGSINSGLGLYTNTKSASTTVSGANYRPNAVAVEGIVSAFGPNLAAVTRAATSLPLPTDLAGTIVFVRDSAGTERQAPLFFVSPTQVNYQIPPGTASGTATVTITSGSGWIATETIQVQAAAPGFFSADATGSGWAAAYVTRVKPNGTQSDEAIVRYDAAQNKYVALPIDFGAATDQLFLVLFGTGIRYRSSLSNVTASIGGSNVEVLYAGSQPAYIGLDQINIRLPRSLAGRGSVNVEVTLDGKPANPVQVSFR